MNKRLLSVFSIAVLYAVLLFVLGMQYSSYSEIIQNKNLEQWFLFQLLVVSLFFMVLLILVNTNISLKYSLKQMQVLDPLTGAKNDQTFKSNLELELLRSQRYTYPVSLVLLDIDDFPSLQSKLGFSVSNSMLTELADFLSLRIRESDALGRQEGSVFSLLLPHTSCDHATILAEKLRKEIQQMVFSTNYSVTASFGIAEYKKNESAGAFLQSAVLALQKAKLNGKNGLMVSF